MTDPTSTSSGTAREPRDIVATVSGNATVEAAPDRVRLSLRVRAAESSARAATDTFATTLAGARALLDELGVTYTVGSVTSWEGGKERRTRHQVWSDLAARVEDLTVLPKLVESVLDGEHLEINHLQWQVSNLRELRRRARVDAIADAREVADDYAAALGLRVVQVLTVSDPGTGGVYAARSGLMARGRAGGGAEPRPEIDLSNTEPVQVNGAVTLSFLLGPV
ncbi:SIMPL domain-containing protein [Kineosporia succinea]|uniref:Uncharacterized protein YggE n=1 Tax=Kineosporia succinea TaxID=84632 RepID=A0ABT9P619_9ACTN|nr:SIMPL domain-containing protein [Kineosporia succinea]MDP9828131.1 uncharacterized protein YggE [Kineosporia succinea]